ncbi:RNA-binding protein 44 [Leptosomus discolor]
MELEKNSDVKSKRRCFNQSSHLFSYLDEAEHILVRDVAAGANHSGFGQARSASVSELKLSEESLPYLSSSLDADIEMYNKERMTIGCARVDESKKEADVLGRTCDNTHCNCGVCDDFRQSHLGEDSQLEYLSAHEQDFDDRNSSSEFSEQKETTGIETLKVIDPVHEVPGGGVTQEQNLIHLSEDCSPSPECGVGDQTCPEAAVPDLPHLLQDSLPLPYCDRMTCDHQEEQTEYHSVVYGSILESHSWGSKERVFLSLLVCDSLENGEVKGIPLTDGPLAPQIATSEELSEESDRHIHSKSVKQDNPLLSRRQRALVEAVQLYKCAGNAVFCSCEESGPCACGSSCIGCTAKAVETQFPVSEILASKNPFFGVQVADESSSGNTSCLNLEHRENSKNVSSKVNQAVDACSDFRACFTTSRSTSTQVCLSSRAVNTELTMNKYRPMGWRHETRADVACNTDWSCAAGSTEEIWSQLTDTLEKHSDGHTATAERSSQIREQQESKNELCSSNLKISTDRPVYLDKQAVKNSASSCCQKILQRAIEAELQILNIHYQMCYQHCLKIYRLALEENTSFSRHDNPQTVCVTGSQPSDSTSSTTLEEQHKHKDVECGCAENQEGNEYWFDAKEDMTVADFSVIAEETKKQHEKQDTVNTKEMKITEGGNECSFVRIGGPSASVSEGDLRSHFQKCQISDALTSVDSSNYRSAFLSFKDTNKAKLAVEEMNQKTSPPFSTNSYDAYISPDTLNLSSFTKVMKKLQEIHPGASRDKIVAALLEVRKNNKGTLSGLSLSSIVERASVILRKSTPSCGWKKQCK